MGFKKGWREYKKTRAGTKRKRSSPRPQRRNNPTRVRSMARKRNTTRRKTGMKIPHPSITGLASGAIVALALDKGYTSHVGAWGHHAGDSVTKNLAAGQIRLATQRLLHNATELVGTTGGRKQLGTAIVMATGGAIARKWAGNPKIGGQKLFFRI